MKAAKEKLMESAQKVFAKMYEQAQQAQGAGPDMGAVQVLIWAVQMQEAMQMMM